MGSDTEMLYKTNAMKSIALQWIATPSITFLVGVVLTGFGKMQTLNDKVLQQEQLLQSTVESEKHDREMLNKLVEQNTEIVGLFKMQQQYAK